MRRSQILQGRKRSAFVSPFLNKKVTNSSSNDEEINSRPSKVSKTDLKSYSPQSSVVSPDQNDGKPSLFPQVRDTTDILNILNFDNEDEEQLSITNENEITLDILSPNKTLVPSAKAEETSQQVLPGERYYSVMWCKLSTKKHKKWEGDAILIIKTRSAILKSTDGKVISSGMGYKLKQLEELEDGSTLVVGGKECEIQGPITTSDYLSGRCFQENALPVLSEKTSNLSSQLQEPNKKFCNPLKDKSKIPKTKGPLVTVPRYPIGATGAFVLPRPSSSHQWKHNKESFPIIDLVVDPQLTMHLREHQKQGIVFLYECIMGMREYNGQGAILADEMGLGKTLQCIALVWTLLKQGPYGGYPILNRVLIITPSSLVKNWHQEFKKWLSSEKLNPFAVEQASHVKDFLTSRFYPVIIISYEMFVRSFEQLSKVKFDLVICDEGHRLKNSNIKTSNTITKLATMKRIVLTGTPVQNDLQEFFSIIDFCNPGILGSSAKFKQVYENPISESQRTNASGVAKEIGKERAAELSRLTSLFVLRRTQEVINKYLPTKLEYVVFCKATSFQLTLYKKILSSNAIRSCLAAFRNASGGATSHGARHLTCITALKKLCNHPYLLYEEPCQVDASSDLYDDYYDPSIFDEIKSLFPDKYDLTNLVEDSGKMSVVASILDQLYNQETKEKIVIASNYTRTLGVLEKLCNCKGYSFLRLDGTTPTVKRQSLVDNFNQSKRGEGPFVFLLSAKAGGVGLNLIGASRIILYDIDWNPATDLQTLARIWRDGQKKKVYCYRLLTSGTVEEKIYQRQVKKQCLSGTVVDNKDQGKLQFSIEMLKDLFSLKEDVLSITHEYMECSCLMASSEKLDDRLQEDKAEIEDDDDFRSCQLGNRRKDGADSKMNNKNHGMDELLKWDHISAPISNKIQDPCLLAASENINFVFRNETK